MQTNKTKPMVGQIVALTETVGQFPPGLYKVGFVDDDETLKVLDSSGRESGWIRFDQIIADPTAGWVYAQLSEGTKRLLEHVVCDIAVRREIVDMVWKSLPGDEKAAALAPLMAEPPKVKR